MKEAVLLQFEKQQENSFSKKLLQSEKVISDSIL